VCLTAACLVDVSENRWLHHIIHKSSGRVEQFLLMDAADADEAVALLLPQVVPSGMFPDAFGLDRHRLRLKAGASEKLRLSFLPFYMPPAQLSSESGVAVPGQPLPRPRA